LARRSRHAESDDDISNRPVPRRGSRRARHPIATGEVVELSVTWVQRGVPHAARQVHVLQLDGDGRISRDDMWCGGRWSASLLAEMGTTSDAG
jgi:hypothetical protein